MNIYRAEIEGFAESILSDTPPPIPAEEGIRSLEVVLAAYTSAAEGRPVQV